jgi:3'-5' exoribonuclease
MKSPYISELADGQPVISYFLVCGKEICSAARTGKKWLQLELGDKTGVIQGKMWEGFETAAATLAADDVVKVQARVKLYNGKLELTVDKIRKAETEEYALEDLVPHTTQSVDVLKRQLEGYIAGVKNPWIKRLLTEVLDDPRVAGKYERAPAAMTMHHAYVGGLLEHVVSLCKLCRSTAEQYAELDADLLIAAAVLHDIGKIEEMSYGRAIQYTAEGELLGHILIGCELVGRKMDAIEGFPPKLKTLLLHLIASHHGQLDFGSPKVPQFREAVIFHYLDEIDSRIGAMRRAVDSPEGDEEWTGRVPALGRKLLRSDRYLGAAPQAAASGEESGNRDDDGAQGTTQNMFRRRAGR